MFDRLTKPVEAQDARCIVCQGKVDKFHVFEGESMPTFLELAEAWIKLGRPVALDVSNDLFKYQAALVWPDPNSLGEDDPVRELMGTHCRAHEGPGLWMRPASIMYERIACMNCHKEFPRAIPVEVIPFGAVVRCSKCEIQNQETPRETHLREFLGFLTARDGTLTLGAKHEVDADAMEAGVRAFMAAKGAPLLERE